MNLKIVLQGHYYNHWPNLSITFNNQIIFDSQVEHQLILNFELDCSKSNCLTFEHKNKQFGENGIWDSDSTGEQTCAVQIVDIVFDQVSCGVEILSKLDFEPVWSKFQLDNDIDLVKNYSCFKSYGLMSFNGKINLNFTMPVYNWLIDQKYKVSMVETSYFSDYSSRWHYDDDVEILENIKSLTKYDKNLRNKRTQNRTT